MRAFRRMYITASRNLTSNPTGSPSTLRTVGGVSSIFTAMMSASGATPTNEPSDPPDTWLPPAAVAATWVPWPSQSLCLKSTGRAGHSELFTAASIAAVAYSTP